MLPSKAHHLCIKKGIKVYPIPDGYGRWKMCVELPNEKPKAFDKLLRTDKEIQEAKEKTVVYLVEKLKL